MHNLNFDAPFNSLSLGNVSLNFLRELKKKDLDLSIFPVGQLDFSAFDQLPKQDQEYIAKNAEKAVSRLDRSTPTLKIWHINGSEKKIGDNQFLYTFYELDSPTEEMMLFISVLSVRWSEGRILKLLFSYGAINSAIILDTS